MSNQGLHHSFLRPPILQILRAAGFHSTRPSVLETVVDLTARYLLLLASTTASYSTNNVHFPEPQLEDLCMAMQDCGVFRPQTTATEEEWLGEEDMRGVNAFLDWARGDVNKEIRRIAGRADRGEGAKDAIALDGQGGADDFITGSFHPSINVLAYLLIRTFEFISFEEETQQDGRRVEISGHSAGEEQ